MQYKGITFYDRNKWNKTEAKYLYKIIGKDFVIK